MSTPDYLWPARPEYLRRGTPVYFADPDGTGLYAGLIEDRDDARGYRLDLRDVTARAHAAMAYTVISRSSAWAEAVADGAILNDPSIMVEDDSEPGGLALTPEARRMVDLLCRMRMLDESVTVAEAREALAWAERVGGGPA
jgi:hypothetical protein